MLFEHRDDQQSTDGFEFTLNGERVRVKGASTNETVLRYLRRTGRTGTKEGCAEGDCGACSIVMVTRDPQGAPHYRAVNSCIMLLPMVADREVLTVEGLVTSGAVKGTSHLHPVQEMMLKHYGSQCGYCTPGFVMSMFEAYHRRDVSEPWQIADQLCGNLCRCTGYRPIRDAMKDVLDTRGACARDGFEAALPAPPILSDLDYRGKNDRFIRPTCLGDLLNLRANNRDAVLVGGATEIGVEITKKFRAFPQLIATDGVKELKAVQRREDGWYIGGAVTLTDLEEALGGEILAVDKMLAVFASRQIRSRATLAGNLVTASPIGDMAPVLLALDAKVILTSNQGSRTLNLHEFFVGYRTTQLAPDEIMEWVVIPHAVPPLGGRLLLDSYKVSKRRELDISIVAAGFALHLDAADRIVRARLGYGGVAPKPSRALDAEAALVGKSLAEAEDVVRGILDRTFQPITDARGSADYRRGLVVSLFEKFVRGDRSEAQDDPLLYTESPQNNEVSSASRTLHHESALGHVSGSAQYVEDHALRRDMLELWPVCSPHAHARIKRIDVAKAKARPGVAAVLTAASIPHTNDVGALRPDEILLADEEVFFEGHMVAVVVGESYEVCRAAAAEVEVEYEPLDTILSIEDAIAQDSYHTAPHTISRGDAARAIKGSKNVLDGVVHVGGQEHFYLETHAAWAEMEDGGDIRVISSTQHPTEIQSVVSHVLGLPRNKVVVESPRMGGGFGGKETQGNTWAALAALGAWHTGKPVRVQLDRDLDMRLTGKRHPFRGAFRVAFEDDGALIALEVDLVSNGGWALDLSESICDRALFHIDNGYFIPNVRVTGRVGKTNLVSNTAFRGFGGPQGMVIMEEIIDRVSRCVGLAAHEVRARNLYRGTGETNTTHYGQEIGDNRLGDMWHGLFESAQLDDRRKEIDIFNRGSAWVKRGLAITPAKFGISFTASFLNQAGALVLIYRDGTVQVNHGGTEMGQGLHTKIQGVVMRELGLSARSIRMMKTSTDKVPNTSPTAASAGADLNGAAVQDACVTLRKRLVPIALEILGGAKSACLDPRDLRFESERAFVVGAPEEGIDFSHLVEQAYFRQVSLSATGYYRTPDLHYDRTAGRGKPFHYFACGVAAAEVEVDGYSGMKRVRRVDILHDVGNSLNPGLDRGQVEGGFVQGMGWLTGEELLWSDEGRLLTHSASTYQIPAFSDAPADFRVTLLPKATQPNTIHGSKAVGEPPLMLAICVREAIRDAVAAFGRSSKGQQVPLGCPATHEAIFWAIRQS